MSHNGKAKTRRYSRRVARRAAQADTAARLMQEAIDRQAHLDEAAAFDTGFVEEVALIDPVNWDHL